MTSQIDRVTQLAIQRGGATADDLLPMLPGMTRKQVIKALQNAARCGKLVSTGREYSSNGLVLATYTAPDDDKDDGSMWQGTPDGPQMAYPSVFHFGQGQGVRLTWGASNDSGRRAA